MSEPSTSTTAGAQAAAGTSCSTCGAAMAPEATRCDNCGTTRGEENRCPFCRVVAAPVADKVMRYQCPACGSPRIPHIATLQPTSDAMTHLRTARAARSSQLAWKMGGIAAASFGVVALLILTGVFSIVHAPLLPMVVGYLLTSIPLLFGALGWKNANKLTAEVGRELDEAWFETARELIRRRGILRAAELAEELRLPQAQAEQILVRLASLDEVRSDVTDSGEMALSLRSPPRLRVELPKEQEGPKKPSKAATDSEEVVALEQSAEQEDHRGKAGA